jgi:hypothetical protein
MAYAPFKGAQHGRAEMNNVHALTRGKLTTGMNGKRNNGSYGRWLLTFVQVANMRQRTGPAPFSSSRQVRVLGSKGPQHALEPLDINAGVRSWP